MVVLYSSYTLTLGIVVVYIKRIYVIVALYSSYALKRRHDIVPLYSSYTLTLHVITVCVMI